MKHTPTPWIYKYWQEAQAYTLEHEEALMTKWHGGKGSTGRKVDKEKFDKEWERIFGNKNGSQRQEEEGDGKPQVKR